MELLKINFSGNVGVDLMGKPKKHKRKGPKSTRAGCLLCKPHKRQGVITPTVQEFKAIEREKEMRGYIP